MTLDWAAAGLSIGFLVIGMLLLRLLKSAELDIGSASWAVFFAPILAYLMFSGSLSEFKAAGIEAKFRDALSNSVPESILDIGSVVGQDAASTDLESATWMAVAQRVVVIQTSDWVNKGDDERRRDGIILATSIYQSLLSGGFEGLVVIDEERKPLGFFEASFFLDLLRLPLDRGVVPREEQEHVLTGHEIQTRVLETQIWPIVKHPVVRARNEGNKVWAQFDISKGDAFQLMVDNKLESLVIVDYSGRYIGVLSRDRLVDQLLMDLIGNVQPA